MATQIKIFDMYDIEVDLNDVVLMNYPNPNYFFIGKVQFNKRSLQFELYDCGSMSIPLSSSTSTGFEKLCSWADCPATLEKLGIHDLKGGKAAIKVKEKILSSFKLQA